MLPFRDGPVICENLIAKILLLPVQQKFHTAKISMYTVLIWHFNSCYVLFLSIKPVKEKG